MDKIIINAQQLYNLLLENGILDYNGQIKFKLGDTEATIKTRDTIGNSLQSWLGQWLTDNNYYYSEPDNTQEFPDFYLHPTELKTNMLELKSFNNDASPAFDIANFESYCQSLRTKPYRLDADYLIMGYTMDKETGNIKIKNIWLRKIWQISGSSATFALKTQVKRGMVYNIRPIVWYSTNITNGFNSVEEFVKAIYLTLKDYKGNDFAEGWLTDVRNSYREYYGKEIDINN